MSMNNFINTIGADEVGIGDFFGGIVTSAVFLNKDYFEKIKTLNIKDSKKLTINSVIELAKKLIKLIPYSTSIISVKQYNFLYNKFKNAHIIKTYAHNLAISKLQKRFSNEKYITILDQYASKENYEKYLAIINPDKIAKIDFFETKAENKYIAVACASIIARYYFLKQIADLSKYYHVNLPLGYNKDKINITLNKLKIMLNDNYEKEQYNLFKMHFKH